VTIDRTRRVNGIPHSALSVPTTTTMTPRTTSHCSRGRPTRRVGRIAAVVAVVDDTTTSVVAVVAFAAVAFPAAAVVVSTRS
jgi:hypothetical protein